MGSGGDGGGEGGGGGAACQSAGTIKDKGGSGWGLACGSDSRTGAVIAGGGVETVMDRAGSTGDPFSTVPRLGGAECQN